MDPIAYVESVARESAALRAAADTAGLNAAVMSCPGWDVADLVWHLTAIYDLWVTVVAQRLSSREGYVRPARPPNDELLAMFDNARAALLQALAEAAADVVVWTWTDDHTVGFVQRRMAQETVVHRWDAESAAGRPQDIDPLLASDGIDEFLHIFLLRGSSARPAAGSIHIHCGDVAGEWTVRPSGSGYDVTREHAKGDCALRGPASNLLLALWGRIGLEAIDVVGDTDLAQQFVAANRV